MIRAAALALLVVAGCQRSTEVGHADGCARDDECDGASLCTAAGACALLPGGTTRDCQGGTDVSDACNELRSPSDWQACVGPAGPAQCPYCALGSCYQPGLCQSDDDCHGGTRCTGSLCVAIDPFCPTLAAPADVIAGAYAVGHELCVRDTVRDVDASSASGDVLVTLASDLQIVLTPLYALGRPTIGRAATFHGTVRWVAKYSRYELRPIDRWME